jgi:hypothetical protein
MVLHFSGIKVSCMTRITVEISSFLVGYSGELELAFSVDGWVHGE